MKRSARWLAALLVSILLPVQGLAATCAELCAKIEAAQHMLSAVHGDHCHEGGVNPDEGVPVPDGKCCHAHTFMTEPPVTAALDTAPSVPPACFVARWTSFIPEEPSPPPIASAA